MGLNQQRPPASTDVLQFWKLASEAAPGISQHSLLSTQWRAWNQVLGTSPEQLHRWPLALEHASGASARMLSPGIFPETGWLLWYKQTKKFPLLAILNAAEFWSNPHVLTETKNWIHKIGNHTLLLGEQFSVWHNDRNCARQSGGRRQSVCCCTPVCPYMNVFPCTRDEVFCSGQRKVPTQLEATPRSTFKNNSAEGNWLLRKN